MLLPKPECSCGFTKKQIVGIMGLRTEEFWDWMRNQTVMLCDGKEYNHAEKRYQVVCDGVAHGTVIYQRDVERFLAGLPVRD